MPLIKSSAKEAVSENIRREMKAGKPQRQAIAIALNTQREAKRHGYAAGGTVQPQETKMDRSHLQGTASLPKHKDKIAMDAPVPMRHMNRLGATNLQQNPNGVGKPSTASKVNGGGKTW